MKKRFIIWFSDASDDPNYVYYWSETKEGAIKQFCDEEFDEGNCTVQYDEGAIFRIEEE